MCLVAIALGMHPQAPLVIASNRDEFFNRPAAALARWTDGSTISAGRDLQGGGTWLGFTDNGRFAVLTNVREPGNAAPPGLHSRGGLVSAWLNSSLAAPDWARQVQADHYAGCNIILGDWPAQRCFYMTNRLKSAMNNAQAATKCIADWHLQALDWKCVHTLSNAQLDTPWPKTLALRQTLARGLHDYQPVGQDTQGKMSSARQMLHQTLLTALQDDSPAPDADVPRTGLTLDKERALSSARVRMGSLPHLPDSAAYGTRCSTVASLDPALRLHIQETTYTANDQRSQVRTALQW